MSTSTFLPTAGNRRREPDQRTHVPEHRYLDASGSEKSAHDAVPDIIRAHSFELVDHEGDARAQFGFGNESGDLAQIVFLDPSGETRLGMTCGGEGAAVGFVGKNGLRMA